MSTTPSTAVLTVTEADYPAVFQMADRASLIAQRRYLRLMQGILFSTVLGAGLGAFASLAGTHRSVPAVLSAVMLALGMLLNTIKTSLKLERAWYRDRAVAESTKSMSWRYMTRADPYGDGAAAGEVDHKFLADLRSIVRDPDQMAVGFGREVVDRPQISERMRQVRDADVVTRLRTYLSERIADQRRWYSEKARSNGSAGSWFSLLVLLSQAAAFVWAAMMIANPEWRVNLTGLFAAMATAFVAWPQVKQHESVAQSYAIATMDLGLIQEQGARIEGDAQLAAFVADAENAISREHTLWVARRDKS
jgi:hypothetical protein